MGSQAYLVDELISFVEGEPMPTSHHPTADASEARRSLIALAEATRTIQDPAEVPIVLESLSAGLASVGQVLHQLAQFHEAAAGHEPDPDHSGSHRATSYQATWELHRAAEIVHHAAAGVNRAQELDAGRSPDTHHYGVMSQRPLPQTPRATHPGLSL